MGRRRTVDFLLVVALRDELNAIESHFGPIQGSPVYVHVPSTGQEDCA
jgi:hypothetical protein